MGIKIKDILNKYHISIKLALPFLEAEISFNDGDKAAAWELYIEMLTRIATQPLPDDAGDELTALESMYSIFGITRSILKAHGRACLNFSKIAIPMLNQIIRPFTAKWHKLKSQNCFEKENMKIDFRSELRDLQSKLKNYVKALAEIAEVEDLSALEDVE